MIIAIDAWFASSSSLRGIGKVTQGLISELISDNSDYFIIFTRKKSSFFSEISKQNNCKVISINIPYVIYEQLWLPIISYIYKPDIFHSMANTMPIFLPKCSKRVLTLHDLIFMNKPLSKYIKEKNFGAAYRNICLRTLNKSEIFFHFISEHTKACYLKRFDNMRGSAVIYNGIDRDVFSAAIRLNSLKKSKKNYLFALGAEDPRKNTEFLIKIFIRNLSNLSNQHLIIAGIEDIDRFLNRISLTKEILRKANIKLLPYISSKELHQYYSDASGFIFISKDEGFGLPIIEAQIFGLKCIVSNNTSCNEVAGPSSLLVDPCSEEQIINSILKLQDMDKEDTSVEVIWASQFTWKLTAKKVRNIYEEIKHNISG